MVFPFYLYEYVRLFCFTSQYYWCLSTQFSNKYLWAVPNWLIFQISGARRVHQRSITLSVWEKIVKGFKEPQKLNSNSVCCFSAVNCLRSRQFQKTFSPRRSFLFLVLPVYGCGISVFGNITFCLLAPQFCKKTGSTWERRSIECDCFTSSASHFLRVNFQSSFRCSVRVSPNLITLHEISCSFPDCHNQLDR